MTASQLVVPSQIEIAHELLAWAEEFLMIENPDVRRPTGDNTVCPFVRASVESDSFTLAFHPEVNGQSVSHIEMVMNDYIPVFKAMPPFDTPQQKSLLVVFPAIPERQFGVLDRAHMVLKDNFVHKGLMLGQFHKRCRVHGIYNERFQASVSPHPLMAIRQMAIHDIVFLEDNRAWFDAYNRRFGERFRSGDLSEHERHYASYYRRAKERHNS
jgi:hypothetical protein